MHAPFNAVAVQVKLIYLLLIVADPHNLSIFVS